MRFQGSSLAPATDPHVHEWTQSVCERRGHIRASPGSLRSGCQPRICSCERCPEPEPSQEQNKKHRDQASGTEGLSVFDAAGLGSGVGNEDRGSRGKGLIHALRPETPVTRRRNGHAAWPGRADPASVVLSFKTNLCPFPGGSDGKGSAHDARDPGAIPVSGRSPGEGNSNPL